VAWQRKIAFSVRVAPLGLGCALLLYGVALVVFKGLDYLSPLGPSSQSVPLPQVEHALTAVHASMVELPDAGDARAVAELAGNARMVWLGNRQLIAKVHKLEARYASLVRRFEANFAGQQESVNQMRSELGRFQDRQDAFAAQLGTLRERDFAVALKQSEAGSGIEGSGEASHIEHAPNERPSLASARGNGFATNFTAARSWASNTGLSGEPSPRFAALQIARRLENTRTEALLSNREQTFTIDVESGLLGESLGGELFQLDPALEIRLDTASSEVINEHSGRIRFFPDGGSTGGRIQLQHDHGGATVNIDWSTGDVTVQLNGD
jgi:general secretion pathway protein H